jgi:hypothetical protein
MLHELSRSDIRQDDLSPDDAALLAELFRDARLKLIRLGEVQFSDDQLHRLQQLDYRLQMVATGHAVPESIAAEAQRALESFRWTTNT